MRQFDKIPHTIADEIADVQARRDDAEPDPAALQIDDERARQHDEQRTQDGPPGGWGDEPPADEPRRQARLTPASRIQGRRVRWLWDQRLPVGCLAASAGREATGKTSFGIWLAAQLSRGKLPGARHGKPAAVFICSVEDSWGYTMRPRLQAAGADLDLVFRFDVVTEVGQQSILALPKDMQLLEDSINAHQAALVFIDPLLSHVSSHLDTHKNHEVRQALDPLAKLADRTGAVILGNAHFNKSASTDVSALIVGSGAFKDVPRAIFGFAADLDTGQRVMTQTKNSLGRLHDLPSLEYTLESALIEVEDGTTDVGRFVWVGESERSAAEVLRSNSRGPGGDDRDDQDVLVAFLRKWLTEQGGTAPAHEGHAAIEAMFGELSSSTVKRARDKAGIKSEKGKSFHSGWMWTFEDSSQDSKDSNFPKGESSESSWNLRQPEDPDQGSETTCIECSAPLFLTRPGRTTCAACTRETA